MVNYHNTCSSNEKPQRYYVAGHYVPGSSPGGPTPKAKQLCFAFYLNIICSPILGFKLIDL